MPADKGNFSQPSQVGTIESSNMPGILCPGFRGIQQRKQDDCFVDLQVGLWELTEKETLTITHFFLQSAEGDSGYSKENFFI